MFPVFGLLRCCVRFGPVGWGVAVRGCGALCGGWCPVGGCGAGVGRGVGPVAVLWSGAGWVVIPVRGGLRCGVCGGT